MAGSASNEPSQIIPVSGREWQAATPTIKLKKLWSDPATKRRAQITRFEPGATLPIHRHVGDEVLYVIEGAISDEFGTTAAGSVSYRPNGCVHTVTSPNGATILAIVTGGSEPASGIGDAPPSQNFVLSAIQWVESMPGMRQKPIWRDQATNRRLLLGRFEPGARIPAHRHVGDELIFVIEGASVDESGEVPVGDANYRPNGCVHSVWSNNGATVLSFVTGGVEMVR
ncbi:MAG: cupin domain-containing protein [Candidatus Binataceae bacterium]